MPYPTTLTSEDREVAMDGRTDRWTKIAKLQLQQHSAYFAARINEYLE
jgi:hypothetical protein